VGGWPPSGADVLEVEAVLTELGLGPLVQRMPAGISQPVGDGGWSLSSGEAARISLARAILRNPDVLVLDETTAALDAPSQQQILDVAQQHCNTIVLIAHPWT
jgi:ATP-binding cassette subfamily B protein